MLSSSDRKHPYIRRLCLCYAASAPAACLGESLAAPYRYERLMWPDDKDPHFWLCSHDPLINVNFHFLICRDNLISLHDTSHFGSRTSTTTTLSQPPTFLDLFSVLITNINGHHNQKLYIYILSYFSYYFYYILGPKSNFKGMLHCLRTANYSKYIFVR